MSRQLPARPNLEFLRSQAKTLLIKLREGDPDAVRTFTSHLPEAANLTPQQIRDRGFRLADAQSAIARKSGFSAWPGLARHVERLRSMEGKWGFRSLEIDGQTVPASTLQGSFLLIDGDRFRMESAEANYEGVFIIDIEKTPHHIDIDFVDGPEAGNKCEGLFEVEGDQLRMCLALVGSKRPNAFATKPGSGHALEELSRLESARPAGVDGGTPPPIAPPLPVSDDPGEFDPTPGPTLQKLQGEWQAVELITAGAPLQESWLPHGFRSHNGIETKVTFGGQIMMHAKVRVNEDTSPFEVDYLGITGKANGSLSLGLFRWEGGHAVYCTGAPGAPRPTDFTCAPGSGRTLSRWKRKA